MDGSFGFSHRIVSRRMSFIADGPAGRASPAGFLNANRRRPDAV